HLLAGWRQSAPHPYFARAGARHGAPGTAAAHDRPRPRLSKRKRGRQPRAHLLPARRHDDRSRRFRRAPALLHENAAHRDLPARRRGAPSSGLLSLRRAGLRARYPVSDLRRSRVPRLQAQRLGGTAALRPGQPQCPAHQRHRSRAVGRFRLRPRPHAPRHDEVRHRRYPLPARRRSPLPGAVLTVKFSYNWIREFVPGLTEAAGPLERLITMKTAECEGIEETGALLAEACVARVESVEPIPGSHNVKAVVDAGPLGRKTVVCGAPNCRPGLLTAYVPLKKIVVHGVESDGMLASGAELGINRDRDGIVELGSLDGCAPDSIIEIDNKSITHRPDLWGHHGLAREVAAILGLELTGPARLDLLPQGPSAITIRIEDLDLCPRYSALVFENITVQPSPLWLQYRLTAIGINPINNIVGMTNFVM